VLVSGLFALVIAYATGSNRGRISSLSAMLAAYRGRVGVGGVSGDAAWSVLIGWWRCRMVVSDGVALGDLDVPGWSSVGSACGSEGLRGRDGGQRPGWWLRRMVVSRGWCDGMVTQRRMVG